MMASYVVSELEAITDVDGHLWEARWIRLFFLQTAIGFENHVIWQS